MSSIREIIHTTCLNLYRQYWSDSVKLKVRNERTYPVSDMSIDDLVALAEKGKIPYDAELMISVEGGVEMQWYVEEPATEYQREAHVIRKFNVNAFTKIAKQLLDLGYKRAGFSSAELKRFDTMYNMYTSGDFESLEEYMMLHYQL